MTIIQTSSTMAATVSTLQQEPGFNMPLRERGALCKALYTNVPESKNELGFRKGEILTVVEYDYEGQNGWWLCTLRGQRGICPSNYLEVLEDKYSNVPPKSERIKQDESSFEKGTGCLLSHPEPVNPLETYDFPRSVEPVPVVSHPSSLASGASSRTLHSLTSSLLSLRENNEEHTYANDDQPLYQNDTVDGSQNPLDLYDVPRSELPVYGQSLTRLRKYGSCCTPNELTFAAQESAGGKFLQRGKSVNNLTGVHLRRPLVGGKSLTFLTSNRSSIQSESAESGIGMASGGRGPIQGQDLYDVPRGTTRPGQCSRPPSALSMTSSGMGLSIATSDSKDSLDCLYDVPRGSSISVKSYVNHMEAKYDDVRRRHDSASSNGSRQSSKFIGGHTRNNSTSSIFSAYGYSRNKPDRNQAEEAYDVPRGSSVGRFSRPGTACSRNSSNGSLNSEDPMQFYDVPSQFARKVSVTEQLVSSSPPSLTSSVSSTKINQTGRSSSPNVDVKILPLGPKAAVSVCDKLRQEIVSSITSILGHVKPKWRTKENLTEIMPDLKFACTRLSLAIKDVADFATRSLSNAKRLPDDSLAPRLHRLLTPVINGSQIIQRDVDELDAYFWSVDRLSQSGGDLQSSNHFASGGDALDQLILCSRSLKHDVTELANFLAVHSTTLYTVNENSSKPSATNTLPDSKVEDTQDDYDYVSLVPASCPPPGPESDTGSNNSSINSQELSSASSTSTVSWHLEPNDQQLLEFYSGQITVTAPQLSQSIQTFIGAIQQNEPPSVFNGHLKYVVLLAYKLLFAGDTIHRNISNQMLKEEVEQRANDLHKSILTLYEASKIASTEFPKIQPMQMIVDRVWAMTQAATQLKKCIFNAVCT